MNHDDDELRLLRESAQMVAEGLTESTGFAVAMIALARGGDDDQLTTIAVAGNEDARRQLLGRQLPIHEMEADLALADVWGSLRFVPGERVADETDRDLGWIPDIEASDDPTRWHPLDLLVAPFHDELGRLRGHLCVDLPRDGRRPDIATRAQLERFAEQARRVVFLLLDREQLTTRLRLAERTRDLVRSASAAVDLDQMLDTMQTALLDGFLARSGWLQTFDHVGVRAIRSFGEVGQVRLADDYLDWLTQLATRLWRDQLTLEVPRRPGSPCPVPGHVVERLEEALRALDEQKALVVPLGVAGKCLGIIILGRASDDPAWSDSEATAALDIGHDLGRVVLNARNLARERALVEELRELDAYKRQLIATVSHELKAPLTATVGHLELLESLDLPAPVRDSLEVIQRASERTGRTVDSLLLLSRVTDPDASVRAEPVDLRDVVRDSLPLLAQAAAAQGVRVTTDLPPSPVVVVGDHDELERVTLNLLGNAIKYSTAGGQVQVGLTVSPSGSHRSGGATCALSVTDTGLGISVEDQERLFDEFFRSTNPHALQRPGTGLGLAIVRRIAERHAGRIEVVSELGRGSTFTVTLPWSEAATDGGTQGLLGVDSAHAGLHDQSQQPFSHIR
ncbi:ATP-binding protein [Nocardioides acrostichi]|uniref:histidine kinase n=1 Tax=Nocardioides acrostichi TaxID=2784339 RepID=A0A930V475_9ACTN|nr:GAF domain-containing sensor histidine kinase [Nocardioides acrostichi]MBF4162904.1 GAF domain-containing sensor histidine kinase [Nocardioides acrostichi]